MKTSIVLVAFVATLGITNAKSQSSNTMNFTSATFSSGGGTSSGGGYSFTTTLGEPISGSSSGGGYSMVAGFTTETVEEGVDLKLTLDPSPLVVTENIDQSFTVTVANDGSENATGVQATVNMPEGLRLSSATSSAGTCMLTSSNLTCMVASLASNSSFTVSLTIRADFLPEQANEFESLNNLTAAVSGSETDLNSADNSLTTPVTVWLQLDFGDANSPYPVSRAENGARHRYWPGYQLGALWDRQADGFHSVNADWDDTHGSDDEDGVTFPKPLVAGTTATVVVNSSFAGFLDAWADFNNDGDWADAGEQIFASQALVAGDNKLSFPVPPGAALGNITTRWRASTTGGLSYTGYGGKGEVEDDLVTIHALPRPTLDVSAGTASLTFPTENQVNYVIEYTDSLVTPNWQPLKQVVGNGQDIVVKDSPEHPMRFYRVRLE